MEEEKPQFKKIRKKKIIRTRLEDEESESENEAVLEKIEQLKTVQRLRSKRDGIEISTLMPVDTALENDHSRIDMREVKLGGLMNLKSLKNNSIKVDDAYDTGIGTQFSAETNKRDEDEEMMKYIEDELSKRKKKFTESNDSISEGGGKANEFFSPEEAALQALPEHLRISSAHHSEEMLSNQMLSGIPEVDLGIEVKIKNIEATEEAKLKLLWEHQNKSDGPSSFVPSNMAVNFIQQNRFNIEDNSITNQEREELMKKKRTEKRLGKKEPKATDDYHYERFKKQFRRY